MPSEDQRPKVEDRGQIDWTKVKRVLVVKLRSIGDTVLATPSLKALRRFLPDAEIDILLEDWVAPLLEGFEGVNVISVGKTTGSRIKTAVELWDRGYDLAVNLHGGTTATFFVAASRARHRVGYRDYRYSSVYNHLLTSSGDFWQREETHSAEQQLALLGFIGVPVDDRPRTYLPVLSNAAVTIDRTLLSNGIEPNRFALFHGTTTFETKRWSAENFARTAEFLSAKGIPAAAVAGPGEETFLEEIRTAANVPIITLSDLPLPAISALASAARLFVGIDSGIAHIAAAVETPSVVIFGYSNRDHWRPWTDAPHEVVYEEFACQPCAGYRCEVYGEPKCIQSVTVDAVSAAIDRVLRATPEPAMNTSKA